MSRSIILLALAVAFAVSAVSADKYCLRQSGDQYAVEARDCTPLETDLVEANYNKTYNMSGWDEISISPLQMKDMNTAYYLAGYLEGYLTWDRIWATYVNTVAGAGLLQSWPVLQWIEAHRNYIVGTVAATASDPFSSRVAMLMQQMEGLSAGYNTAQPDTNKWLNSTQFFWLSFQAEFMDIINLVQGPDYSPPTLKAQSAASHCSALIKDTGADLFMAHDTWSAYASMLRQFKVYNFDTTVALSGYPGVIHSIDDWYMTSNRLTVQETTNEVYNVSLTYDYVVTTTVSEFLRVMTANYLATSGSEWVTYANTQNSGTYCNQWMVVDQKLFVPNEPNLMTRIPDGTFWVYEQAPGPFSQMADMSGHLRTYGYWASYNAWYFPSLQAISGQNAEVAEYGSFFSYTNYSRAEIFRARQGAIQNLTGMHDMMRYNNFRHDPLSLIPNCKGANAGSWNESNKCTPPYSAMLTIASRGDLEPSGNNSLTMGPLAVLGFVGNQQPFGAIDSKITSHLMTLDSKNLRGSIICGPTQSHGLPAFAWEDYTDIPVFNYTWHLMHTPEFNFPWLDVTASPAVIRHPSNDNQGTAIAVVIVLSILLVGIFAVLFIRLHVFKIGAPVDEVSPLTSA